MNAAVGEEQTPSAPEPATPGELLRREREQRGLSVQHAAEELHLDTWAIEALENNRFTSLGAPVYAKGYLRKYALMLGVSPETVMARYEALSDTPAVPVPAPTQQVHVERVSLKKPLWVVGSLAAVALLAWIVTLILDAIPASAPAPSAPTTTPNELPAPAVDAPPVTSDVASPTPSPADVAPATPVTRAPVEAATPSGAQVRLRLEFSETSWAEVYDATGRRLMFGLGEPGRVRTLAGVAPLRVTLGAASGVTAQVNDEPIVIPRRAGRDAAKFVIDAAGEVATNAATASEQ